MSGESMGAIGAIALLPIAAGVGVCYGIAKVVGAVAEKEKLNRELQRRRIEAEARSVVASFKAETERELSAIAEKRKQREEQKAQRNRESDRLLRQNEESREKIQSHAELSMGELEAAKKNLRIEVARARQGVQRNVAPGLGKVLLEKVKIVESVLESASIGTINEARRLVEKLPAILKGIRECGYDAEEKRKTVEKLIYDIETELMCIPSSYHRFIGTDVREIQDAVASIKTKLEGNLAYQEDILRDIWKRLIWTSEEGKEKSSNYEIRLEATNKGAQELLISLEMVLSAPFPDLIEQAAALRDEVLDLYAQGDLDVVQSHLADIEPQVKALYGRYIELDLREAERVHILESVQEIMTEMGYEPRQIQKAPRPTQKEYGEVHFSISGGMAVRFLLNDEKSFFAQVYHREDQEDVTEEEFREVETKFCKHLPVIVSSLQRKDLEMRLTVERKIDSSIVEKQTSKRRQRRHGERERRLN